MLKEERDANCQMSQNYCAMNPPFLDNLMVLAIWKISTFLLRVNEHLSIEH